MRIGGLLRAGSDVGSLSIMLGLPGPVSLMYHTSCLALEGRASPPEPTLHIWPSRLADKEEVQIGISA